MADRDAFMIGQFAKELVTLRLQTLEDPCAAAAALVREAASVALRARPEEADRVVSDACYGALQALLLARHDVARGAALMLAATAELAAASRLDPEALRGYALEGFARMRRLLTQDQLIDLLETLESRSPGAGTAFVKALALQPDPGRARARTL